MLAYFTTTFLVHPSSSWESSLPGFTVSEYDSVTSSNAVLE